MSERIEAARALAAALVSVPWRPAGSAGDGSTPPPAPHPPRAWFALGDPQAPLATVLEILDRHRFLTAGGWIDSAFGLLSIGDHFDWEGDPAIVGRDGMSTLRWLAAHPPSQVVLIAGNHDLNRVMEFAGETDARFAEAREMAREIAALQRSGPAAHAGLERAREEFHRRFPAIPTPGIAARDCLSWSEGQRALVRDLLTGGRFRLAAAGEGLGRPILFTHAGVTARELGLLGLDAERDPVSLAAALQRVFGDSIDRAAAGWARGEQTPLDLSPFHYSGTTGREGGGLLYHRPANPEAADGGISGPARKDASRRYDPRTALPRGLAQVCGHTGHRKCLRVLGDWADAAARAIARGGLRTLRTDGVSVSYSPGILSARADEAVLWMIDGEMNAVPAAGYSLFPFDRVRPGASGA